jgi:hypothetical protein
MTQTPQEIALEAGENAIAMHPPHSYQNWPSGIGKVFLDAYHAKLLELGAARKGTATDSQLPDYWLIVQDADETKHSYNFPVFSVIIIKTDSKKS